MGQKGGGRLVLLELLFMSEHMSEQEIIRRFEGDWINSSLDGHDERILGRVETTEEEGNVVGLSKRLPDRSKSGCQFLDFTVICFHRHASLFDGSEAAIDLGSPSMGFGCKAGGKIFPGLLCSAGSDKIWQDVFRHHGDKGTKYELILLMPKSRGAASGWRGSGARWRDGRSIKKTV